MADVPPDVTPYRGAVAQPADPPGVGSAPRGRTRPGGAGAAGGPGAGRPARGGGGSARRGRPGGGGGGPAGRVDAREWRGGSPPATAAATAEPAQVGPYVILERISEGGMGIVYKAEQRWPV